MDGIGEKMYSSTYSKMWKYLYGKIFIELSKRLEDLENVRPFYLAPLVALIIGDLCLHLSSILGVIRVVFPLFRSHYTSEVHYWL